MIFFNLLCCLVKRLLAYMCWSGMFTLIIAIMHWETSTSILILFVFELNKISMLKYSVYFSCYKYIYICTVLWNTQNLMYYSVFVLVCRAERHNKAIFLWGKHCVFLIKLEFEANISLWSMYKGILTGNLSPYTCKHSIKYRKSEQNSRCGQTYNYIRIFRNWWNIYLGKLHVLVLLACWKFLTYNTV